MKLSAIALDYDGTIASHGRAHPVALEAIRAARSRTKEPEGAVERVVKRIGHR